MSGNARISAITTTSAIKNQIIPLKIWVKVVRLPTTPFITKTFIPIGGVIIPISSSFARNTPKKTRFIPASPKIGRKTGNVRSIAPIAWIYIHMLRTISVHINLIIQRNKYIKIDREWRYVHIEYIHNNRTSSCSAVPQHLQCISSIWASVLTSSNMIGFLSSTLTCSILPSATSWQIEVNLVLQRGPIYNALWYIRVHRMKRESQTLIERERERERERFTCIINLRPGY